MCPQDRRQTCGTCDIRHQHAFDEHTSGADPLPRWPPREPRGRDAAIFLLRESLKDSESCWPDRQPVRVSVERYAGHRGEQTPRTLILGEGRVAVAELLDAWLVPD